VPLFGRLSVAPSRQIASFRRRTRMDQRLSLI
jgi:hypothetical protein